MRHGKKVNHLGRTASHRSAMLSNMASSLILHKRINTTLAKAKALRKYVEPLLTKAKDDSTNSRRVVFSYLQNKETIKELFGVVAEKIAARPGGYTRILKTGTRLGDSAEMCMMELVDFNELMLQEAKPKKARRSRRAGSGKASEAKSETTVAEVEEAEVIVDETVVEDTTETVAEEQKEEKSEEVKGAAEDAGDSTTDEGTEDSDKPKA